MNRTVLLLLLGILAIGITMFAVGGLGDSGAEDDEDLYAGVTGDGEYFDTSGGTLHARGETDAARAEREAETTRRAEEAARRNAIKPTEGVQGTVTDGAGNAIAKARVMVLPAPRHFRQWAALPPTTASALTDENGVFLVGPAPEHKRLILRAEAAGYAPSNVIVERRGTRVDLVLDRGGRLNVRVLDMDGKPVAGARVMHSVGWNWQTVLSEAVTADDGVARFPSVPTGSGNLVVAAKGLAAVRQSDVAVSPGEKEERTVILDEAKQISGKVLEKSSDLPIEGAAVAVHYPNLAMIEVAKSVATDADGAFRVTVEVAAGEQYELRVRQKGFAEARVTRNLNVQDEVVVKLTEEGEGLSGTVFAPGGSGIGGVKVTYAGLQDDKLPEATTNDLGEFELPRPPFATNGVTVIALSKSQGFASMYVRLNSKTPGAPIRLTLPGAGDIEGIVRGKDGEPVQGALIALEPDVKATQQQMGPGHNAWQVMNLLNNTPGLKPSAVSDAEGKFLIRGVPALAYRINATFGRARARSPEPVLVTAGLAAMAEVTLEDGGTIEGWVLDTDERPVAGAYVYARPMDRRGRGWGMAQPNARTQSDGRFVLQGIEDWEYTIHVSASGYGASSDKNITRGTTDLTLRLAKLGTVKGIVEDERGGPFRGTFRVHIKRINEGSSKRRNFWMNGNDTQIFNTDDGEFEIRGRTAGKYEVRASTTTGLISAQQEVVEIVDGRESREIRLRLSQGAKITGRVMDESTGKPLRNAYVYVNVKQGTSSQDQSGATSGNGRSNAKGVYEVKGLGAGSYTVTVWADGANWSSVVDLTVGETKTLDLTRRQPGSVRIQVLDTDGVAIKGAYPQLRSSTGQVVHPNWQLLRKDGLLGSTPNAWQEATTTNADGVNLRYHVPPGRYQVTANRNGYSIAGQGPWIDVHPGSESSAEVTLKKKSDSE